jgi:hypothetical protein
LFSRKVAALRYAGVIVYPTHYGEGMSGLRRQADKYSLGDEYEEKGDIPSYFMATDPKMPNKLDEFPIASGFGVSLPLDHQCDLEKSVRDVREL